MPRWRLAADVSVISLGLMLAGCGGGGTGGGTVSTPPPPTPSPAPTPTPTPAPSGYQTLAPNPSVTNTFETEFVGIGYNGDPETGQILPGTATSGDSPRAVFKYSKTNGTYELVTKDLVTNEDRFRLFFTGEGDTNPSHTSEKFLGYTGDTFGPEGTSGVLRLYRAGNENPEIQLTYSSFGHLTRAGPLGHLNFGDAWFSYGFKTKADDIPQSGSATYSGILYGFAVNADLGKQYDIEGSNSFFLDFSSQQASGTFNFVAVANDGTRTAIGTATFANSEIGSMDGVQWPFGGALSGTGVEGGMVRGFLYGPRAAEIGGIFAARLAIDSPSADYHAQGAFAAVKD